MHASAIDPDRELFTLASRRAPDSLRPGFPGPAGSIIAAVADNGTLCPVYGGWMLRACAPADEVQVLVLDPVPARPVLFGMFLWFETSAAVLNEVEKARAVVLAAAAGQDADQLRGTLRMLGIPATDFMRQRYTAMLDLDDTWLTLIAEGRATAASAFMLEMFTAEDRRLLAGLFRGAHLTARMQAAVLEGIRDFIRRDGRPLTALWPELAFEPLLDAEKQTPRERGTALCRRIDECLRPAFSADRARFTEAARALSLGQAIAVEPSPAFEAQGIRFAFAARDAGEFRAAAARLTAAGPRIDNLFNAVEEETDCD